MLEALWMLAFVAAPLIGWTFFLKGWARWLWFSVMTGCLTCVLIGELVAKLTTGHTISQHFWIWEKTASLWQIVAVIGLLVFGWLMLMVHLLWKKIFPKKQ